jgi:hypothetical protein
MEARGHAGRRLAAAVIVALAGCPAGCDGDGGDDDRRRDGERGEGTVAVVAGERIELRELERELAATRRAHRGGPKPSRDELHRQAMAALLRRTWLELEAADRGIAVDQAEAHARWRAAAREQFRSPKALKRFLGRQNEQDIIRQLRVQMLREAINEHVRSHADGDPDRAVERFERDFHERWQNKTSCHPRHSIPGCRAEPAEPPASATN